MLVYADGSTVGTIGGGQLEHRVIEACQEAIDAGVPQRFKANLVQDLGMCCGGSTEVYIEPLRTRLPMVIYGAGHVAHALAPLLATLDFDVEIVDPRDELATRERFPAARLELSDPIAHAEAQQGGPEACWLVVTHDHALDQAIIERLLPKPCAYLGMIGSRAKVSRFLVRYRAAGLDEALFHKLSAPVGLDIGAETPSEIAVSIAAELVRLRRGAHSRPPTPLSEVPLKARGGDGIARAPGFAPPSA